MQINIIAVGTKMPTWVNDGWKDYIKRLPRDWSVKLTELPALKRGKNAPINNIINKEAEAVLAAAKDADLVIALDRIGKTINSKQLASHCDQWIHNHQSIAWLVGGPEGLSKSCLERADAVWSLSEMTLPHPLVRVLIAEQLYRAWSILNNHPYHR